MEARLTDRDVEPAEIEADVGFAQRPGVIVVTVDERHLPMQRPGPRQQLRC